MASDTFVVKTGLTYPIDPAVDAALIALREHAAAAHQHAAGTADPRDMDAAQTADRAVHDAVANALAAGTVKRAEIGAHVSDLPAKSIGWLLEQGLIVKIVSGVPPVVSPVVSPPPAAPVPDKKG